MTAPCRKVTLNVPLSTLRALDADMAGRNVTVRSREYAAAFKAYLDYLDGNAGLIAYEAPTVAAGGPFSATAPVPEAEAAEPAQPTDDPYSDYLDLLGY